MWVPLSQRITLLYFSKLMAVAVDAAILLSSPGCMNVTDREGESDCSTPLAPGFQIETSPAEKGTVRTYFTWDRVKIAFRAWPSIQPGLLAHVSIFKQLCKSWVKEAGYICVFQN